MKGMGQRGSRTEKKIKKAMGKLGLKPVTGYNRVTIKNQKNVSAYPGRRLSTWEAV